MTKVFVVVLNWKGFGDTKECLGSVGDMRVPKNVELKIVVVDNASGGNEMEKLRKLKKSMGFELIENTENLGFAGGNNVGIRHAMERKADWVMVLNNDTTVDKDLVVEFIKAGKRRKKAGMLSPKIYFAKGYEFHKDRYKLRERGRVIWCAGGEMDWNNVYANNRGVDEVDEGQYDKARKLEFATGACMMLRKKALEEGGLFDERYFLYLEDADLSQRMIAKKWEVWYVPKAKLWHKVSQSSAIGDSLSDYYLTRNKLMFAMRYAPVWAKQAVIRESFRLALEGRRWQKVGAKDFYLRKFGKGSYG